MSAKTPAPLVPGLGPKSSRALAELGIHSLVDLSARDPYEVYRKLKASHPGASLSFLYGLIAAVQGRHWREVQRNDRMAILMRLDAMGLAPKRPGSTRRSYVIEPEPTNAARNCPPPTRCVTIACACATANQPRS